MTLEKEQETMPKTNNRKEILKIRVEINEKEHESKINKRQSQFFGKISTNWQAFSKIDQEEKKQGRLKY